MVTSMYKKIIKDFNNQVVKTLKNDILKISLVTYKDSGNKIINEGCLGYLFLNDLTYNKILLDFL